MHATAVTASQKQARWSAQRAYNGQLLQLLRALPGAAGWAVERSDEYLCTGGAYRRRVVE